MPPREPGRPDTKHQPEGTLRPGELGPADPRPGAGSELSWGVRPAPPTSILAPGEAPGELGRLGGYRVLEILGQGGMGVVFLAEDPQLRRKVAIKCMLPEVASRADNRNRFFREARLTAAVEHENVIPIYQIGEDRNVPFLVMPALKGETLADRLKRDKALPVPDAVRVAREVAAGLAAAHAHGLTHRDVKPSNVWLEAGTGRVKILDFGLARGEEAAGGGSVLGQVMGTPGYMAPEQATGAAIDHRADLFSLGCILYEMTTGRQPFDGSNILALLANLAVQTPDPPHTINPDVPRPLSDLIQQMLEKDPNLRPASAAHVLAALEQVGGVPPAFPDTREFKKLPAADRPPAAEPIILADSRPPAATPAPWDDERPTPTPRLRTPPIRPAASPAPVRRRPPVWVWVAAAGGLAVLVVAGGVAAVAFLIPPDDTRQTEATTTPTTQPTKNGTPVRPSGEYDPRPRPDFAVAERKPDAAGTELAVAKPAEPTPAHPGEADYGAAQELFFGNGGPADRKKAVPLFRAAADRGYPPAQYWLAQLLLYGYDAVPVDRAAAMEWLRKAADDGYPPAQAELGHRLAHGDGVPKDAVKAQARLEKALPALENEAEGHRESQYALGLLHLSPGSLYRPAAALNWLTKAAEAGHPTAPLQLARMHASALGVPRNEEAAVHFFKQSAGRGNAVAQRELGRAYALGRGERRDDREALTWAKRSAEQGYPDGMADVGLAYSLGRGVERDEKAAVEWFTKAANAGSGEGMFGLGRANFYGLGAPVDMVEGTKWYAKAADAGDPLAAFALGLLECDGYGLKRDRDRGEARVKAAEPEVRRLADSGDPLAQGLLGEMYLDGYGAHKDEAEAVVWYRKAADRGEVNALNWLGNCYRRGTGVGKDEAKAFDLYKAAAERDLPLGQLHVGEMLARGFPGTAADRDGAMRWYRPAADAGLAHAQWAIGAAYERDPNRKAEAARWFRQAADAFRKGTEHGDRFSQFGLAQLYENGWGVDRDLAKAKELYQLAADQGSGPAAEALKRLEGK